MARSLLVLAASLGLVVANSCPFGHTSAATEAQTLEKRAPEVGSAFIDQFVVNSTDGYMTTEAGGPIEDQNSLKAGERGPTLLEDFILRQKITHFDHERVPERAVHARGAGAHGVFESYADHSNLTAASFLGAAGKKTPVFVRFSTVAGSRGSADTARDVHGFATRFYTDEGNFDIVGNNIPVFFIQDAILFPDLIHAVKPQQDREMPTAATAHDSAWDFFSSQPSALHTLFWAMSGQGIVRSYRHMDGFGVHTFRFVTNEGKSKLIKFHFKTLTGKAGLVWEEAQQISGKNADYHRQDLWETIENGQYPEWEFGVQVMDEEDVLRFGFDLNDPTKVVPEELVPITKLGKMTLNRNPTNYFAEVEQVMFQPAHLVRGIDFSDDPLLQGRLFSYLDTQLNRHGGPNFEQLPINRPHAPIHNNNRDGAGQMLIHANNAPYSPNTLNKGFPKQANQKEGKGFFTAPYRRAEGRLRRSRAKTFTSDFYSQPRLFYNSILPEERQFLTNAIVFETSHLKSETVKRNVIEQLNKIHHGVARSVAETLGIPTPVRDAQFYHNNKTTGVSMFEKPLMKLDGLKVGILATTRGLDTQTINKFRVRLARSGVSVIVVAETLVNGVDATYSTSDSTDFDAIVVANGAGLLFQSTLMTSTFDYPAGRPSQILTDSYRFGKPIAFAGDSTFSVKTAAQIPDGPGIYHERVGGGGRPSRNNTGGAVSSTTISKREQEQRGGALEAQLENGLRTFRFLERFRIQRDNNNGGVTSSFGVSRNTTVAPMSEPQMPEAPVEETS